jgi:predicted nucleic acid-binding protein
LYCFIAAQAIVDGLQIVTADKAFSALDQIEVVWE